MIVHVKHGKRYAIGVVAPAWLPDAVLGTELLKSDELGWTNAILYKRGQSEFDDPSLEYSHIITAMRSGPDEAIDISKEPYAGRVVFVREAYPLMPGPSDGAKPSATPSGAAVALGLGVLGAVVLIGVTVGPELARA